MGNIKIFCNIKKINTPRFEFYCVESMAFTEMKNTRKGTRGMLLPWAVTLLNTLHCTDSPLPPENDLASNVNSIKNEKPWFRVISSDFGYFS